MSDSLGGSVYDSEKPAPSSDDVEVVNEAKQRYKRCQDVESNPRRLFSQDLKFANADPDNTWQWPEAIKTQRDLDQRPCLTINKVRQHNLLIINEGKKNSRGIKIRAAGGAATYESAQIFEGLIRNIEYVSQARQAYSTALDFCVKAGIGYWRVLTEYVSDDTFDQMPKIKRIKDPNMVYLDPDIDTIDGSDARFGFIFTDVANDEFRNQYPDHKDMIGQTALDDTSGWIMKDHIRVAEYYRRTEFKDKLITYTHQGQRQYSRMSKLGSKAYNALKKDLQPGEFMERDLLDHKIEWFKIAGVRVIEKREVVGKYVPIVRVVAEETIIDGAIDRKGHTRNMKDAQRIYNYNSSASVEYGALQTKSPWVAPAQAIAGLETYWRTANITNHSILPFNHKDSDDAMMPPPFRPQPPGASESYMKGMEVAQNEMMMASGQWQAQQGQNENAKSGVAINERKAQGDVATYHFTEAMDIALCYTGKILLDMIPKLYDTERVEKIMGEDGQESEVTISPQMKQAMVEKKAQDADAIAQVLFNPSAGVYDTVADTGPAYATRRAAAFDAFTEILTRAPQMIPVLGDIYFRNGDFPMSDEAAQRMRRMVPAQALGDGPPPELVAAQDQVKKLQEATAGLIQKLADRDLQLRNRSTENAIRAYDAESSRVEKLAKAGETSGGMLEVIIRQTVAEMLGLDLDHIVDANVKMAQQQFESAGQNGGGSSTELEGQDDLARGIESTGGSAGQLNGSPGPG